MNVESVGKTVEEALEAALKELNLKKEEVDYTVLIEPKKGFLGFGKKEAKILVGYHFPEIRKYRRSHRCGIFKRKSCFVRRKNNGIGRSCVT